MTNESSGGGGWNLESPTTEENQDPSFSYAPPADTNGSMY